MQKDTLRELAINGWERTHQLIKQSVKAKLKVIIKRTLKRYGYPPDMEWLAIENVLKQAEMIADELAH